MLEAGAEVWARRPVRTMGGCRRVEIAAASISWRTWLHRLAYIPFWPDSRTASDQLDEVVSK